MTENLILMIIATVIYTAAIFMCGYHYHSADRCKKCKQFGNSEQSTMLEKVFTKQEKIKEESEYADEKVNPFYQ